MCPLLPQGLQPPTLGETTCPVFFLGLGEMSVPSPPARLGPLSEALVLTHSQGPSLLRSLLLSGSAGCPAPKLSGCFLQLFGT